MWSLPKLMHSMQFETPCGTQLICAGLEAVTWDPLAMSDFQEHNLKASGVFLGIWNDKYIWIPWRHLQVGTWILVSKGRRVLIRKASVIPRLENGDSQRWLLPGNMNSLQNILLWSADSSGKNILSRPFISIGPFIPASCLQAGPTEVNIKAQMLVCPLSKFNPSSEVVYEPESHYNSWT